ncbi:conserved protein of unknown function [Burkholderia multivorans]
MNLAPRRKPFLIVALVIAVIAAIGYAYASPYVALDRLRQAIDARDAQAVSEYVDFPSLRASLKQQLSDTLMRRIDAQQHGNPLAVIGALIGSALIGPLVDAYATPEGVAALMSGMPPRGNPGERPPEWTQQQPGTSAGAPAAPAAAPASQPPASPPAQASPADQARASAQAGAQTHAGYRNIDEFVVMYQRGADGARYAAIFHRTGLFSWKLSAVDLHD